MWPIPLSPPNTPGQKNHRLWFAPSEISPSEAPDERAWTAGNTSAHSDVRRARDPHAARCLRLFVLTVTSILRILQWNN